MKLNKKQQWTLEYLQEHPNATDEEIIKMLNDKISVDGLQLIKIIYQLRKKGFIIQTKTSYNLVAPAK